MRIIDRLIPRNVRHVLFCDQPGFKAEEDDAVCIGCGYRIANGWDNYTALLKLKDKGDCGCE